MAILIALEMAAAAGCTSTGPCLSPSPPPSVDDDAHLGPCLKVAEPEDPVVTPCLSMPPDEPQIVPCLEVAPPEHPPEDPEIGPCLKIAPAEPPPKEPRVGPCLRVAPPRETPVEPCLSIAPPSDRGRPTKPSAPKEDSGATARADIVEKLADSLPADVLAKLRDRDC